MGHFGKGTLFAEVLAHLTQLEHVRGYSRVPSLPSTMIRVHALWNILSKLFLHLHFWFQASSSSAPVSSRLLTNSWLFLIQSNLIVRGMYTVSLSWDRLNPGKQRRWSWFVSIWKALVKLCTSWKAFSARTLACVLGAFAAGLMQHICPGLPFLVF